MPPRAPAGPATQAPGATAGPSDTRGPRRVPGPTPTPAPNAEADVIGHEINSAPVISFSENPVTVVAGGTFTEPTVTVTDDHDTNIIPVILSDNTVNTDVVGSYIRIYTATDSDGLTTMAERVVNIVADDSNSNGNGGSNGSGRSGSRRRSSSNDNNSNNSNTAGQVLGASTGPGLVLGAENFQFLTNLGRGMANNDVVELQKRLRTEGYFFYPTNTGYFGPFTQIAVMLYQVTHGIEPSLGFVGPITRGFLNR